MIIVESKYYNELKSKKQVNFKEVNKGDTVTFDLHKDKIDDTIKVGDLFRIGPLVGHCESIDSNSVTMKVISNSFKNYK